jgi:ABC-type branched-subunit amino acid transport system permease subunit
MGGIGNLKGAVLGGLIIGSSSRSRVDNGSAWTPAVVFAILILIMVFRPQGLLGEETREADEPPTARVGAAPGARRTIVRTISRWPWSLRLPARSFSIVGRRVTRLSTRRSDAGYVIMALGLNIVVGFAGLLDLGYVAFFAIGAFVRAGSARPVPANVHFLVVDRAPACRASTSTSVIVLLARRFTALWARSSARRRCACAATTSRS